MPQILLGPSLAQPPGGLLDLSWSVLDLVRATENTGWSVAWQIPHPMQTRMAGGAGQCEQMIREKRSDVNERTTELSRRQQLIHLQAFSVPLR